MQTKTDSGPGLPSPDAASAAHSKEVIACIADAIRRAGGSISFAEYMQLALYAPGLGYYSAGAAKLGPDGDFVTSPEISPLFGYVVARQCAFVLEQLGGGSMFEPGAGSGALAASILARLDSLGRLPDRYLILEVSADLQERQEALIRHTCPQFIDRVEWVSELPQEFAGVVIANEVADAIPVERFKISGGGVLQARIALEGDRFAWHFADAPAFLHDAVRQVEADLGCALDDQYESEISPALTRWVYDLAQSVGKGMVLLIDYGMTRREYYARERNRGWLRCHFRHRAHSDPLILAGIQDITSWVDFSGVADAADSAGMTVAGFVTQAHFLMEGGLQEELADFTSRSTAQQVELSGQVKLLTLPDEMGENFKCIGLCRGDIATPPALLASNRAHLL